LKVRFGNENVSVTVVRGGSTRMQPLPFVCTQYQNLDELSVDRFHASETLVAVEPVIRRLLGTVGGVRSRAAAAGSATSNRLQMSAAARPRALTDRQRDMATPLLAHDGLSALQYGGEAHSGSPVSVSIWRLLGDVSVELDGGLARR
jgi:hypothetical protein